ncbi:hypothetical protein E2C01_025354 [Portunus trituberculatus]|uniref:Uncharacterized protein n=1 Tax=Portunus trituberculatus TaxID=210409 RepID=A0A5B7ED53_PORTR|nr:hypothetical protein [Portunus trituberculatus]
MAQTTLHITRMMKNLSVECGTKQQTLRDDAASRHDGFRGKDPILDPVDCPKVVPGDQENPHELPVSTAGEVRDGCLGERANVVLDREKKVPRTGTSCEGTTAEHKQDRGAVHCYWSRQPLKDLSERTPGEVD